MQKYQSQKGTLGVKMFVRVLSVCIASNCASLSYQPENLKVREVIRQLERCLRTKRDEVKAVKRMPVAASRSFRRKHIQ